MSCHESFKNNLPDGLKPKFKCETPMTGGSAVMSKLERKQRNLMVSEIYKKGTKVNYHFTK